MSTTALFEPSAPARERERALIRDLARLMNGELSKDEATMVRFASAESIRVAMHRSWCRPEAPERPIEFPDDDRELLGRVRFAMRTRASEGDRQLAAAYGSWRYAVWVAESEGAVRILCLLSVVDDYQAIIDAAGGDAAVEALRDEVLRFLSDEWGINVPAPKGYAERRQFAAEHARMHLIPTLSQTPRAKPEEAPTRLGDAFAFADSRLPREKDE